MKRAIVCLLLLLVGASVTLEAHAFLERSEPEVGSTIQTSPGEVQIWFSEKLKPGFSMIQVFDASGREVDKLDAHLDHFNHALLRVSLPPLQAGKYRVVWRVVSLDTHATKGSFMFRVAR